MSERLRIEPDDDVWRVHAIFLGPKGATLPWSARYVAYGVWIVLLCVIYGLQALTIGFNGPPIWGFVLSILGTYGAMAVIDHDRTVRGGLSTTLNEARQYRTTSRPERTRIGLGHVRVHTHQEPPQ